MIEGREGDPYKIDTGVLIEYLRDYPEAVTYVETRQGHLLRFVVTIAELYAGVREGEERTHRDRFLLAVETVPLDPDIIVQVGLYHRDYIKKSQC